MLTPVVAPVGRQGSGPGSRPLHGAETIWPWYPRRIRSSTPGRRRRARRATVRRVIVNGVDRKETTVSFRRSMLRLGAAVLMAGAILAVPAPAGAADTFVAGSPGLGDPFFPLAGNGGYDVSNYSLRLTYDPGTRHLVGSAAVSATATQNLFRFDLDLRGFVATDDGAFVVGEPQGSPGWYPVNDNPRDKATYDFNVTVPAGLTVMANGVLVSQTSAGGASTFVWREDLPMAPYLATATLGRFDLTQYRLADGLPVYIAVDPTLSQASVLKKLPDIVAFYTSIYGPYPFDAVGAIVDDAKQVGYSLETQTKPVFDKVPDEATLAHELSHMWHGDSVTLTLWPDIWLHEGFATWSEWIWSEYLGQKSAHQYFNTLYNTPAQDTVFWTPPPGDPGTPAFLF